MTTNFSTYFLESFEELNADEKATLLKFLKSIKFDTMITLQQLQSDVLHIIAYALTIACALTISPWFWVLLIPVVGLVTTNVVLLVKNTVKYAKSTNKADIEKLRIIRDKLNKSLKSK